MRSTPRRAERPIANAARRNLALLRIGASAALAEPALLLARGLLYVLLLVVLCSFWNVVAAERLPETLVDRLPPGGLALYIGATEWITLSVPAIHLRLEDDIRSGAIEAHLLRPQSYLLLRVAESGGRLLVRLGMLGLVGLACLALAGGRGLPWHGYAYLAVAGVLAGGIGILIFACIGLTTFWLRRCLPVFIVVQKIGFLLGGLFAPITLYPAWLERLAKASPFAAQLFWPASVAIEPSLGLFVQVVAAQLAWIAALALLLGLFWRVGLARLLRRGV